MSDSAATDVPEEETDTRDRANGGLPDPDEMSQEEIDEIEADRERRLAPENRPEMAVVDNTDKDLDDLASGGASDSDSDSESDRDGADGSESSGRGKSSGLPDPEEISQEELDEIEAERERRLAPENRPETAVVDNTQREFDLERGEFVDSASDDVDAAG